MSYITFENVTKEYHTGGETVLAANNVCFEMEKGELSVVLGPSGAGKTTILNLLGGMDRVTSGKIIVDGKEIKMYVEKGQKVIYSKYAATEVKLDGEEYIVVRQSDILAIVE